MPERTGAVTGIADGLVVTADPLLVSKGDLGIRNDGRQKECVGSLALGAADTADAKRKRPIPNLHGTSVVAMNGDTGGVAAGTGERELVELDIIYNRIIKRLRNLIAIFDK